MSDTTGKLKDLIELLHDGEKFYTEAATRRCRPLPTCSREWRA
ncbi:PA2169 family four-helix-bundle protein [Paucibacter sp. O1-1]|nr:PA2169 family four-helix-bundle protein [Paucibacter sp. O1-1]MDA3831406.1 PA2169 family four-helix-bundle protein [Paucibacter sp. O1-1]